MASEIRILIAAAVAILIACRDTPTAPSVPDRLRFPTGGYTLSVLLEGNSESCVGDAPAFALASRVLLTREDQLWTGRSVAPGDGNVEFSFRVSGGEPPGAVFVNIAGMIRGIANDVNNPVLGALRRSVRFGSRDGESIALRGRVIVENHIVIGELSGPSRVEGLRGSGLVTCSSARWSLTPP